MIASWQESYDNPRQCVKKQRHHFASESAYSQGYSLLVVIYGCESWTVRRQSAEELMLSNCGAGEDS